MTFSVDSTLTGIHSRSEETVKVSRDYDRGRTTKKILEETFERDAKGLVDLELEAGITRVSDGQLKWQDFLRPFSNSIRGLKTGADLSRWFDTNSFYRKPSIIKKIALPNGQVTTSFLREYTELKALEKADGDGRTKKKISLPGPYTLASLVNDETYGSKEDVIEEFSLLLGQVISSLPKLGIESIQINEPALVYRYGDSAITPGGKKAFGAFLSAFEKYISKKSPVEIYLHTYFGDSSKILSRLLNLDGVAAIGIDFTQTSLDSLDKIRFGDGKALACGCVDGRNSLIEKPEWIAKFCSEAIRTLKPGGVAVLPSSELKYLPRAYADQKIRAIGDSTKILQRTVA